MAKKVQLQTNGKEWQVIDGEQVLVDVEKQDIDPITSSSCVQIEGFRTLEEAVSDNKMLSQDLTYTKVMDKVGGDYHQNVLDGQYSKAILYGNTQVNLCEEDSSVALQIPTTFTSFNNGELQIKNKENQVVAPLIKGVTMVNLAQERSATFDTSNSYVVENVKGNTTYTVFFNFTVKNTNAGIIIQSYNGNTYLENSIHKTQLGDKVKFTFTTHSDANRFSICNPVAYGGETIQLDDIMVIEGDQTALDIPFFKGMKSVELVRPLTNLFTNDTGIASSKATFTNTNGDVVITSSASSSWAHINIVLNDKIKPNTKYLVMWDNLTTTQTSTSQTEALISVYSTGNTRLGYINNSPLCPTKRSIIFDTANHDISQIVIRIHATLNNTETATTTVTGLRIFEYDDYLRSVDLQSIGWFSGTKNVAVEPVKTCSKNLYPYGDINFTSEFADSWCDAKGNAYMTGDIALKSKSRFLLKKGTYCLSHNGETNILSIQIVDDKENLLSNPFTLKQDTYCTVRIKTTNANTLTTATNIQIERGETATAYVAHDSRYYEPNGQNAIVLRSLPDGVCDTFNLQTGEYIQRIGEAVLDGSEEWNQNGNFTNVFRAFCHREVYLPNAKGNRGGITDTFPTYGYNQTDVDSDDVNTKGLIHAVNELYIKVPKSYLTSEDVDGLKQWLSQNPIMIQYELKNPVTTIIPRTIKQNNNGTVSTVDFGTYTNKESLVIPNNPSYLTINSMTSIKPVVEPITYIDFKTRLKANTDYTIKLNKETNAFVTTNLGGTSVVFNTGDTQKFVKTPSIDLEQNLRISGSGSIQNIMVIEGDVLDKELPYFNGMCNVKMPIVRNCGKNLFDGILYNHYWSSPFTNGGSNIVKQTYDNCASTGRIRVQKGRIYTLQGINLNRSIVTFFKTNDINEKPFNGMTNTTFTSPYDGYIEWYISNDAINKPPKNIQIEEGSTATSYEPYRGNDICIAQGEIGLTQDMFETGGIAYPVNGIAKTYEQCKGSSNNRIRSKDLFKINGGKKYRLSFLDSNKRIQWYLWDASGQSLGITGDWSNATTNIEQIIDTPEEAKYMSLMFRNANDTPISLTDIDMNALQLLELDSTVQLRSLPNGVKDELNLLTGEYIQRVGEVVLDGSEEWVLNNNIYPNNIIRFDLMLEDLKPLPHTSLLSDTFIYGLEVKDGVETVNHNTTGLLVLGIDSTRLTEKTVDGVKAWLQQNPITVQYELAEPIISYPRIVSNTQEREVGVKLPNGICDTYNPSTGITVKRVGKVVLDGSENWYLDTTKTNTQVFGLKTLDMKPSTKSNNLYCETMKVASGTDAEAIACDGQTIFLALLKTKASTLEQLKTYLASNPVTVWYELKNPIVTTDIVLPNGVHDEYNPLTGLYTKRVGYVELDGSETWKFGTTKTNTQVFELIMLNEKLDFQFKNNIICDKLPTTDDSGSDTEKIAYDGSNGTNMKTMSIYIALLKTKASTLDELKQYLSQNPIKVWYELSTPITYQLTPYFGLPMPYAYKDGYLIMDSAYDGQTLPPEITYQLTVNRTGQITQNNIKLKEHTARLSNLEYILIEATLDSIFDREMQNFELELMNIELLDLNE